MSFIFQALPEQYDLREKLKAGVKTSWIASRYRDNMKKGDIVYFWLAGDSRYRGLYGWGVIAAEEPKLHEDGIYRIDVEYKCNFLDHEKKMPILSEKIREDPHLQNHLIFRMAIGTNFLLTSEEDTALRGIISRELGLKWAPPGKVLYEG